MNRGRHRMATAGLALAVVTLAGCGGGGGAASTEGSPKPKTAEEIAAATAYRHPLAEAYYREHANFFRTAPPADLPADLSWEDGMDQPDIGSPQAKKGGTCEDWDQDYPRTLRHVGPDANTSFRSFIHDDVTMFLVKKHPETGRYYPGLATAWAFAPDRRTVYFKLQPAARYSDGVPVTADDYFFTFYYMRSPWLREPWSQNWYSEKYTHITKYDDHTIAVGLKDAKPDPLRFFEEDVPPVPRHFYDEFGEDYVERYAWRLEPTTGPYTIYAEDIRKGRTITLTRVADWWAKDMKFYRYRFNVDRWRFTTIRDVDKRREAFLRGEFDMMRIRLPEDWYDKVAGPAVDNGYIVKAQFYNDVPRPCYSLRMNRSKPLLDNRDIRIGIGHASNWEIVIKQYFRGDYERMETCSPGYGEFTNPEIQARRFSVEKALAHFAKAGFDRRGPDGILVNAEGRRLAFTVTTGYQHLRDVLTILQQEARKAGLDLQLEVLDATSGWKKVQEKKHEIAFTALNNSVELYPRYFDFYHSYNALNKDGSLKPDTNNFTVTADPAYDAIIERYEAATDLGEIRELAHRLQQMVHDDGAFVPGWVRPFYQCAYWRWVRWPDEFNYRLTTEHDQLRVFWIDEELKKETLAAKAAGKAFEKQVLNFDQHRKPKES